MDQLDQGEKMRIAAKLVCAGVVVLLAGCSALNPFSHKAAPRNPPAALVNFKQTLPVHKQWSVSIGSAGAFMFAPAVANDSVFVANADGSLARLDATSGRALWNINTGMSLTAGVGSDGNTVAVVGDEGVLLAYDANGKLRWKAQASSEILSTPAVGQGLVVVRSVDNRIAAYDADSGNRRWIVQRPEPPLTLRSAPGIVITGSSVIAGLPGGRLLALALNNGGPRWEAVIGDPRGTTELERIADISGTPVLAGGDVCAVAYQGRVACVDANTGAPHWARALSSDVGLGVDERFIYAADDAGAVTAFSRNSGVGAWRNTKLANRRLTAPVSVGSAIAVGDLQGYVHFLSREDGALVARAASDGSQVIAAIPLVAGKSAVFQTKAGTVVALATR